MSDKSKGASSDVSKQQPQELDPETVTTPQKTYIPLELYKFIPELNTYKSLTEAEKRVGVYLARKKLELKQNESLWNGSQLDQTQHGGELQKLRIFVYNTCQNQPWQGTTGSSEGKPAWTLRIEARPLSHDNSKSDRKSSSEVSGDKDDEMYFSTYLQSIAVDFWKSEHSKTDEDIKMTGTEQDINSTELQYEQDSVEEAVEWHYDPLMADTPRFHGIDIMRPGTEEIKCTITIQPKGYRGDFLQYSPELASIIGLVRGTFHTALYSLYKYLISNDLLQNDSRSTPQPESSGNNQTNEGTQTGVSNKSTSSNTDTPGDKSLVQLDNKLKKLYSLNDRVRFNEDSQHMVPILQLTKLLNEHIFPIKPIKIDYKIQTTRESNYGDMVFDVMVPKISAGSSKAAEMSNSDKFDKAYRELSNAFNKNIETENLLLMLLNEEASKVQFYQAVQKDWKSVLREFSFSSEKLNLVLDSDMSLNEDNVRKSDFYLENAAQLFENLDSLISNGKL